MAGQSHWELRIDTVKLLCVTQFKKSYVEVVLESGLKVSEHSKRVNTLVGAQYLTELPRFPRFSLAV